MALDFRILGPLEAWRGRDQVRLGAAKQRALLAILLLNADEVVSTDRLVEQLWGDQPPAKAMKTVQVYISQLRKTLEPDRAVNGSVILTRAPGYVIELEPDQLDLRRFEGRAAEGRRALEQGDFGQARRELGEALSLWRGPPLADLAYEPFAQPEIARLEEVRLAALEDRVEADLMTGGAAELVAELEAIVARNPLRERPRRQLMLALYRSGRQAEALDIYRQTRATLVEQLGIEPGRELRELEQAILRQDEALTPPTPRIPVPSVVKRRGGTFVGRERELEELRTRLESALAGDAGLVVLAGEPGIGKTRLLDEFAGYARDRGARVVVGRCWEAGGAPAYWPWMQALRACLRGASPEELRSRLGGRAAAAAELLPELDEVFADLPRPPRLDPDEARFRLFDAVSSVLARTADEHPLVILLDDLHAADEPSLQLLRFLAREVGDARILVVGAYRDTDTGRMHTLQDLVSVLARESVTVVVKLAGLSRRDVARFIEISFGHASDRAVAEIQARADGNPLFLVELVGLLRAEGDVELLRGDPSARAQVPGGVRQLIERRLEALSEPARVVLSWASVLGREFDVETLERLPDLRGAPVLAAIDEAVGIRILGEGSRGPGRLRFSHALVRDAVYDALLPGQRIHRHRVVGEALEAHYADDIEPHLAELAHHFFEAGRQASAVTAARYAEAAGRRANAQFAYEEAAGHFDQALTCLEWSTAVDRRPGESGADVARRLRDAGDLSGAVRYAALAGDRARARFENEEAIAAYRLAVEFGAGLPAVSTSRLAEDLGELLELIGRHEEARQAFAQALATAPTEEAVERARLERQIGDTFQVEYRNNDALARYQDAEELLDAVTAGERGSEWREEWLNIQLERMAAYYWMGRVDEMSALEQRLRPAVTETTPAVQRIRYFHLAKDLRLRQTRYRVDERTLELARAHLSAAEELGGPRQIADAVFEVAFCELFAGHLDAAEEGLEDSLIRTERIGDAVGRLRRLAYLTMVARFGSRERDTAGFCEMLVEASREAGLDIYLPLVDANQAWLALRGGEPARARELADSAITGWAAGGIAFPFQWTARLVLIAVAAAAEDVVAAVEQADAMLAPEQQPLPDHLTSALTAARAAGDPAGTQAHIEDVLRLARAAGYV